jgi:hypothetical protein
MALIALICCAVRCIDLTCAVLVVASSDALSSAGRRVFGTLRDTRTVK